ncbi:MAG: hypothetical protein RMJ51_01495 [Candidatus Calescibacterium sp.]|nr:hypothetical protein [Candidatus Calescibacterium sp.]MCX7972213.1 hypothetical protein [bacterium]MDW8194904.1 hypothetical protein [Candidatus Calescibacterium sp.]
MTFLSVQTYIEIKVFDLLTGFYYRAQKINALTNFSAISISVSKGGKYLSANFVKIEQTVVNRKTLGYVDVSSPVVNMRIYLTEDFDWVLNIENRILRKITSTDIDYIFYKVYGYL